MEANILVKKIEEIVNDDKIWCISGKILDAGNEKCGLSDKEYGCVYGIAVFIDSDEKKKDFFKRVSSDRIKLPRKEEWKPIEQKLYPLYWGKDKNMGVRLAAHCRELKGTNTLQLCNIDLNGFDIIYGAVPCRNYEEHELELIRKYPCLLKTKKGKKGDALKYAQDELLKE